MGEISIQVKVLKENIPVLFTWWNKDTNAAEACLITCPCQRFGLRGSVQAVFQKGKQMKDGHNTVIGDWSVSLCHALQSAEILSIPVGTEGESVLKDLEVFAEENAKLTKPSRKRKASSRKHFQVQPPKTSDESGKKKNIDERVPSDTEGESNNAKLKKEGRILQEDKELLDEAEVEENVEPEEYDDEDEKLASENSGKKVESTGDAGRTIQEIDKMDDDSHEKVVVLRNVENETDRVPLLLQNRVSKDGQDNLEEDGVGLTDISSPMLSVDHTEKENSSIAASQMQTGDVEVTEGRPLFSSTIGGPVMSVANIPSESVMVLNEPKEPISDVDRALFEALKGFIESQDAKEENEWAKVPTSANAPLTEESITEPAGPIVPPDPVYAINTPAMVKYREHRNKLFLKKLHRASSEGCSQTTICEICGSILSMKQISKHIKSIHSAEERVKEHECLTCGRKFYKADGLARHRRTHSAPTFACKSCDKKFRHNFQLRNHEMTHKGYYPPQRIHKPRYKSLNPKPRLSVKNLDASSDIDVRECEVCGARMSFKSIRRHMLMQHADVEVGCHSCGKCEKRFSTMSGLRSHQLTHEGLQFKCSFCDLTVLDNQKRVRHERSHLADASSQKLLKYKCGYCEKTYTRCRDRLQHEMSHFDSSIDVSHGTRNRIYKPSNKLVTCEICNKTLKQTSMKCHMDSHSGKTWTCNVCGKTISKGARYDHTKLHSNKKEHACSHCSSTFHTKHALVAHIRKHTKEKPIPCRYCDRKFSRYEGRNNHERVHTGERPYKCDLCEKSWKDRPTYSQHMKKHHPGVPLMQRRRPGSALLANLPGVE